jgi:hypothetical protein
MRNFRFFVFVTILDAALLGFLQPAIAQEASPQEKNVDDRIEALDQKVRILERQSELEKENQAAKAKEASNPKPEGEKKSLEELLVEKGVIVKDDLKNVRQVKLAPWIDSISFSGDLRLRYEYFNFGNSNTLNLLVPHSRNKITVVSGSDFGRNRDRHRAVSSRISSGLGYRFSDRNESNLR